MDALVRAVIADPPSIKKRRSSVSAYVTQIFSSFVKTDANVALIRSLQVQSLVGKRSPVAPPFVDLDNSSPAET